MEGNMTIHQLIRNYRHDAKLSQLALAKKTGIPQRNISYWESGRGDPSISACIKLATGLGITLEELVRNINLTEDEKDEFEEAETV